MKRFIRAIVAGLCALVLSACEERPSAEKMGRQIDQAVDRMAPKVEQAAKAAGQKLEKAAEVVTEKSAVAVDAVDDMTLTARVKTALIAEPAVRAVDVNVEAKDGVVALHGKAASAEQKELATRVASGVHGVKSVDNRLVVSGS